MKGFFDNVEREWMMRFVGHRIVDVNLCRLITRFLKIEIIVADIKYDTPKGTP